LAHCFKLLHFHIGSQVPDILIVKKAVQEAARLLRQAETKWGSPLIPGCGGGLGVDYDGSRSAFDSSTNYTLQEYTNDIVYYIADVCNTEKVPHPDIISETAGRSSPSQRADRGSVWRNREDPPAEFFQYGEVNLRW